MWKTLVDKYNAIKTEYLARDPRGKWEFVRNIGIFILTLTGVPVLDPNYKVIWYSYAPGITCLDILISFFYTIYYFIETPITGVLVSPLLFGIVLPSFLCYLLVIIDSKRKIYQSLAFFAGDKIYTHITQDSNPKYIEVIDQSVIKLLKSTSGTLGIVATSMIILLIFPMYAFVFKRDIQLPIPVVLPFTDLQSKNGLTINMVNQVFIVVIGGTGNIGIEIITCILKNNVWASTVAICHSIDEISDALEQPTHVKRYLDLKFRNILVQVQDLDRFILQLSDLYYWKFFLQPIMLTFSVSIAVFFYLYGDWTSGLGTAFLTYSQLYILCDIGNEVDSANKMLVLKFQEMPWHLMSKQNQLSYAHLLNRLQNGAILQMGPFAELNFETFSNMTNKIYSVLMMLIRITK